MSHKDNGNACYIQKKYDQAIEHYTMAIELTPNDHTLYSNRSGCYASIGKYNEAANDAVHTIAIKPDFSKGYRRKAYAEYMLGRYEEALNTYQQGLIIDPNNTAFIEGILSCKKIIEENKTGFMNDMDDMMNKLMTDPKTQNYFSQPDFMQSLSLLKTNPQMAMQLMHTDKRFSDVFSVITGIEFSHPKETNADPITRSDTSSEDHTPLQIKADNMKLLGNEYYNEKNWNSAIKCYDDALMLYPYDSVYLLNKAAALLEKSSYNECLNACDDAIALGRKMHSDPQKIARGLARKATCYQRMGNIKEAIHFYRLSYKEYNDPEICDSVKKLEEHQRVIEEKAYMDSQKAYESVQKADALYIEGKYPESAREYSLAIKRDPFNSKVYLNRATAYCKIWEWRLAMDDIHKSIQLSPNDVTAYAKKGNVHFYLKEFYQAIDAFNTGLSLDANNKDCIEGLSKALTSQSMEVDMTLAKNTFNYLLKAKSSKNDDEQ